MAKIDLAKIDVVILAGGQGTRLRSTIGEHQKCTAQFADQPFILHLFQQLHEQGFRRFVVALGYQANASKKVIMESIWPHKASIEYAIEDKPLGTAGALKNCLDMLHSDRVLVLNGDTYTTLQFASFLGFHQASDTHLTIASTSNVRNKDAGFMRVDPLGKVRTFQEKEASHRALLSMGTYVFDRALIEMMPDSTPLSLEEDYFPMLIESLPTLKVMAYQSEARFIDIGEAKRFKTQTLSMENVSVV